MRGGTSDRWSGAVARLRLLARRLGAPGLLVLAFAGVIGCQGELRHRILSVLFEGVPVPGETPVETAMMRSPRHPPPATPVPTPTPRVRIKAKIDTRSWERAHAELPKADDGAVDWMEAMRREIIEPRAAPEPEVAPDEPQELELVLESKTDPAWKVPFSHRSHTALLQCPSCHTDIFEMTAGAAKITMADLDAGRYCGVCHGSVAFGGPTACARCHLAGFPKDGEGNIDWTRALKDKLISPRAAVNPKIAAEEPTAMDVELASESRPGMKVLFSHEAHTEWLACPNCHPAIFEMAAGTAKMTMDDLNQGRYCGVCHGPVAFPIATGCQRCHLAHFPKDVAGNPDWQAALQQKIIAPRAGPDPTRELEPVFPLELKLVPTGQPEYTAVMSHQAHTRWLACDNCHEAIFPRKAGATRITMADINEGYACGVCHGTVAFGGAACVRCHPALGPAK